MTAKSSHKKSRQKVSTAREPNPLIPEKYYRHLHIAMFLLGFVLCGYISIQMGQDNNWDLRNYHYYNPFAWLTDRIGFDFAPGQMQSYLNPLLDMPYYVGMTYLNPKLFGFLMGGIHGLNLGFIFAIAFLVLRKLSPNSRLGLSLLSAGLGVYTPVFIGELGASQNDTLVSLFVLAALYLFIKSYAERDSLADAVSRNRIIIASLLFGMGVGLKLTMMIFALGAGAALLMAERDWRDRSTVLAIWCFAFLAGFLITNGFWMIRLGNQFGNPVFPFYNNIFQSPWAELHSHSDNRFLAKSVSEALLRPFSLLSDTEYSRQQNEYRDARFAIMWVLLTVAVVVWFVRNKLMDGKSKQSGGGRGLLYGITADQKFLFVFFAISYVIWLAKFSIIRYCVVLEAIMPLLIILLLYRLLRGFALRTSALSAVVLLSVLLLHPIQHEREPWREQFWEVQIPELPQPDQSIILIASTRPWSYLVPQFPPEIRWVRLKSNFTEPAHRTMMQSEIRKLLAEHKGDLYLLSRSHPRYFSWLDHDLQVLSAYGLTADLDQAMPIESRYSRPGLYLWPVRKR